MRAALLDLGPVPLDQAPLAIPDALARRLTTFDASHGVRAEVQGADGPNIAAVEISGSIDAPDPFGPFLADLTGSRQSDQGTATEPAPGNQRAEAVSPGRIGDLQLNVRTRLAGCEMVWLGQLQQVPIDWIQRPDGLAITLGAQPDQLTGSLTCAIESATLVNLANALASAYSTAEPRLGTLLVDRLDLSQLATDRVQVHATGRFRRGLMRLGLQGAGELVITPDEVRLDRPSVTTRHLLFWPVLSMLSRHLDDPMVLQRFEGPWGARMRDLRVTTGSQVQVSAVFG